VNKIRTLVVDDEPMARERIRSLLAQESDVEVVGECADGVQAVSAIQQLSPELVFLDGGWPQIVGVVFGCGLVAVGIARQRGWTGVRR